MAGRSFGHYEIVGELGAGGMGQVLRARDTQLGREIAIKILPAEFAHDVERSARFEREARTLAALHHPNIASLFGFEKTGGQSFLVMELVEGDTLAERIARGPVALDEAVAIALQIIAGMEEAHGRGIVHRDLKPANVKITPDDKVKILDFGLARAYAAEPSADQGLTRSPTITAAMTQAGVILGTAGYMSPEQAKGKSVDHRTDIWAFGVMLFEMLTGRRLFGGETVTDALAAVVRAEPPWEDLPPATPPHVRRLLRRCLQKDPRERLQAIGDARLELSESETPAETVAARRRVHPALALVLLLPAILSGWWIGRLGQPPAPAAGPVVRSTILLDAQTQLGGWSSPGIAVSPDGTSVAYVGAWNGANHLFVRRLHSPTWTRVPQSEWAEGPFFSPDGSQVVFANGAISGRGTERGQLRKYSMTGGTTQTVCEVADYFGGTWAEDGTIYFVDRQPLGLRSVAASGGASSPLHPDSVHRRPLTLSWPQKLGGRPALLVTAWEGEAVGRTYLYDLTSGELKDTGLDGVYARSTATGHVLIASADRRVQATRFDFDAGVAVGGRVDLFADVSLLGNWCAALDISPQGTLVYAQGPVAGSRQDRTELMLLDFEGNLTDLGFQPDYYGSAEFDPLGQRIAVDLEGHMWVFDVERRTRLRLPQGNTSDPARAKWTADGEEILFSALNPENSSVNLHRQRADGVQPPQRLESQVGEFYASALVPGTGRVVLAGWHTEQVDTRSDLWELDLDHPGEVKPLLTTGANESTGTLSPDGRWLAYGSDETGRTETYLRSYPDLAQKIAVGLGSPAFWSVDGKALFVLTGTSIRDYDALWAIDIDVSAGRPRLGTPTKLTDLKGIRGVSLDPKGRGFLVSRQVPGTGAVTQLTLIQNWHVELERLLPRTP